MVLRNRPGAVDSDTRGGRGRIVWVSGVSARPGLEGEGDDSLEVFSGCAAGGLDGEAVDHCGEKAGEVGGVGVGG